MAPAAILDIDGTLVDTNYQHALAWFRAFRRQGDDVRAAEKELYMELIDEVEPFQGARELIVDLKQRGHAVVLASSAKSDEVDHYLDLLDARELVDAWTDSGDVEAAGRAGIETVAVLTGGFSEAELREAGAAVVFESIEELRERVGQTPLGDGQTTRELPRQA